MICMIKMQVRPNIRIIITAEIKKAFIKDLLLIASIYLLRFSKCTILLIKFVIFKITSKGPIIDSKITFMSSWNSIPNLIIKVI
jgi:hypothetical protein